MSKFWSKCFKEKWMPIWDTKSAISIITNKVIQAAIERQNRPLDRLYMIVWMDGIVFKVRESDKIVNKTIYL